MTSIEKTVSYYELALTAAAAEGDAASVIGLIEGLFAVLPKATAGDEFVEYLYTLSDADRAFIMRWVVLVFDGTWHFVLANKPS